MPFVSTRGEAPQATLKEALLRGLAPDGGLYMPQPVPRLPGHLIASLKGQSWPEMAKAVVSPLLAEGDVEPEDLERVVDHALDFPLPLIPLSRRISVLELFHGPTLAFKDVGARFMANLVAHFRQESDPPLTVLTATSGDTGGAVAHAFLGMEGIRVVVLFPDGKVTPRQERQFSTLGRNVQALAVRGDFDDCQRLAKAAFQDPELNQKVVLTSANSINVGRLLPQALYYFHAWAQLGLECGNPVSGGRSSAGGGLLSPGSGGGSGEILFSVPSGNFGNLAAGLMAKAMGLPGVRFLAATNANDGVPVYLRTGRFTPRPSTPTLSTAMDVGNPSNLARILHLYGQDLDHLRSHVVGRRVGDEETGATIRRVFHETGYTLDPHSAVGFAALDTELAENPSSVGILLATAHPAKFAEVVEPLIGERIPIPPRLAQALDREREVVPMEPEMGSLTKILLEGQGDS